MNGPDSCQALVIFPGSKDLVRRPRTIPGVAALVDRYEGCPVHVYVDGFHVYSGTAIRRSADWWRDEVHDAGILEEDENGVYCVRCAYDGPFGDKSELIRMFQTRTEAEDYARGKDPGGSWLRVCLSRC
jgi:hypothetical protein